MVEPCIQKDVLPAEQNVSTNIVTNTNGLSTGQNLTARLWGFHWEDILDGWEESRNYWYMNYYQECNQPKITAKNVRVFDTMDAYRKALDGKKFRCPSCGKKSADPYNCKACGWAVYGLLGDLGKGVFVYVKEKLHGDNIFMPIAWEEED